LQISEFTIAGAHGPLTCSLAQPDGPIRPGLLLTLGMSRQSALTEHPHNLSARLFLAAGYQVLSFDLPCHGSRVGFWGAGLDGMASAIAGGADPFEELVADGRAVLDHCISHGIGGGGKVLTIGVSRAGYCALRLAAADRRIAGVAGLAPVTDWRRLTEFTAIAERTETAALALDHWAAEFVGRPVFLAIGNADERALRLSCFAPRPGAASDVHTPVSILSLLRGTLSRMSGAAPGQRFSWSMRRTQGSLIADQYRGTRGNVRN
jgi:pimeloyl-ACP methyl ester carboxylesterase